MSITKIIGSQIKTLRIEKNVTIDELCKKINMDKAQLSRVENGKISPTLETIENIVNGLNINISELFKRTEVNEPKPFIKWVGGKTQLLNQLIKFMPKNDFNKYYEPFIGGGALFFKIHPTFAVINDQNREVISAYRCFQNKDLFESLKKQLLKMRQEHSEETFLNIRKLDHEQDFFTKNDDATIAARMIYLNKTCFNGLFRVNSKGFFNVPSGKKTKVNLFEEENFESIFNYFYDNSIVIKNEDFETCVSTAGENDFVYFDPPYDKLDNNSFTSYQKNGFDRNEQIRLRNVIRKLTEKNVKVMISNHNTEFINEIYQDFYINVVHAKRMVNCDGTKRGGVEEVIITNYSNYNG